MYVVFSINKIKAPHLDDFVRNVRLHAGRSNRESGCVRYEVLEDTADPQTICLYEVFVDEAAFHAHVRAPYYLEWMQMSKEWRHREQRTRHVLKFLHSPLTPHSPLNP